MRSILIVNKDIEKASNFLDLVDWNKYEFKILGICSNGIQAMELIFRKMPDLVFISLELTGLQGMDIIEKTTEHGLGTTFVITEETGDFESAQAAMRLGVREYLVSPIESGDFIRVLESYINRQNAKFEPSANEYLFSTRRLLRNSFMHNFVTAAEHQTFSIEDLNRRYHFTFKDGYFQVVLVQLRNLPKEEETQLLPAAVEELRVRFDPVCNEMIPYVQGPLRLTLIFNYDPESGAKEKLYEIEDVIKLYLKKHKCTYTTYSVGVGTTSTNANDLMHLLHTAERAAYSSILRGTGRTYYFDELIFDSVTTESIITPNFLSELEISVELMDFVRYENTLRDAFKKITPRTDPEIMVRICSESTLAVAKACDDAEGTTRDEIRRIIYRVMNSSSFSAIINTLVKNARDRLEAVRKEREFSRPVLEATKYIKENFTQNITLENVAEHVHLNASYLSMLFKKETGTNYISFLTDCRINEAKQLLKNSGLSVAEICYTVGFTDKKYFSRLFSSRVGVRPTEYRSIH